MTSARPHRIDLGEEHGFTLAELLVATVVSLLVLGGAVSLTSQVQTGYRRQIEDSAAQQEGRYALDWIAKLIRGAGNDPFNRIDTLVLLDPLDPLSGVPLTGPCPTDPTTLTAIQFDPDDDSTIRLQTDAFPPDGLIGGNAAGCNQGNEDVTVSYDADNRAIVFFDNNLAPEASIRTDAVIDGLRFIYYNSAHSTVDAGGNPVVPRDVAYVETQITIRTRTSDATGEPETRTISSEVRVRTR
jgi:prepilin-type N-terminal cleavage/methylation domain-containing protein